MESGFLLIGEVAKPHGLRGQVKVHSYASSPESFSAGRKVFVGCGQALNELMIAGTCIQAHSLLLTFQGIESRQQAEGLVGQSLYLAKKDLKVLPEGEYYWFQLIGSRVITDGDRFLGVLEEIFSTAAHDIWVIREGRKEVLFPAVESFILSVNETQKEIRVRYAPGLSEDDDP